MRRIRLALTLSTWLVIGGSAYAQAPMAFRVLCGVTDASPTRWDGSLKVKNAGAYSLEGWRFESDDSATGNHFHFSTRRARSFGESEGRSVVANGLIMTASAVTENSEFVFKTAQGEFSFGAAEIPYVRGIYELGGRVYVDRIPVATRLTNTREEEDYPSVASGPNGDIWLAYVQFHHSADADKLRAAISEPPRDFKQYAEPTGGDQIWARKYSAGNWGEAIAITPPGRDLYKTAVAVDGNGRVWVFWSENDGGSFNMFARAVDASGAKEQVRISNATGADIDPVAATDASGRVWVAWQGWRDGLAAIYVAHQEGSGFSKPTQISNSKKNEWDPAIAADKAGRVAVAWDSYRNGNYDVYARIFAADSWGDEIPIAATARYEAYPSIAFDPTGRLWIAYEEGGRGWGKDFGAYASSGISLYQGRRIALRGLEPDGRLVTPDVSFESKLAGAPTSRPDLPGHQNDSAALDPDVGNAWHRADSDGVTNYSATAKNTLPRLAVDGSGRVWLAFRSPHPTWWNPIGTVWTEYLVSFNGKEWTRPIFLNHSDNILDNRPALAAVANGKLLMVNSSDGRRNLKPTEGNSNQYGLTQSQFADPYENHLWSDELDLGPAAKAISVVAAGLGSKPEPPTLDDASRAAIQAIHNYRGGAGGNLLIVRGEFHRHSEISMDGGDDGTLIDQWRYVLDAAAMDWVGCCDHDNGAGREYSWWITQKLTDVFYSPGRFVPMFSYERSVGYPEGHRNVIFAQRGIRPLPRYKSSTLSSAPKADQPTHAVDTQMLYVYLKQFDGIAASHTSATGMGTDWRDNDPNAEPVVEIYQGDRQNYEMPDAPRSPREHDSIGGWRPKGFVNLALDKGYRLGFEASSDHVSTHMSYANLYVKDLTRESVLEALKLRHVYASTDDMLADVECGTHMMGDEFSTSDQPTLKIKLRGTSQFAKVTIIRDGKFVYSTSPNTQDVEFSWRDNQPNKDKASYYYVRGEQDNGELVWASPMWIKYTGL
ncbi:MAG: hypothetical protein ACLQVL_12570 [Terriglobia bacterium]